MPITNTSDYGRHVAQTMLQGFQLGSNIRAQSQQAALALRGQMAQEQYRAEELGMQARRMSLAEQEHQRLMAQFEQARIKSDIELKQFEDEAPLRTAILRSKRDSAIEQAKILASETTLLPTFTSLLEQDYIDEVNAMQAGQPRPGRRRASAWLAADPTRAILASSPEYTKRMDNYEQGLQSFYHYGVLPATKAAASATQLRNMADAAYESGDRARSVELRVQANAVEKSAQPKSMLDQRLPQGDMRKIGGQWFYGTGQTMQRLPDTDEVVLARQILAKASAPDSFATPEELAAAKDNLAKAKQAQDELRGAGITPEQMAPTVEWDDFQNWTP